MDKTVSVGNRFFRSLDKRYLSMVSPKSIHASSAIEAIRVRDARSDSNRFTGIVPGSGHLAPIAGLRGGLYCSADVRGQMAEIYHYAAKASLSDVLLPKVLVELRPTRNLDVANLDSNSTGTLTFMEALQKDNDVHKGLKELGYKDMLTAVLHAEDYSACRGLGLGLAANPEIEGIETMSARDYRTVVGGDEVFQTGDNIVLFKENLSDASNMVRVTSLHLVDRDPSGALVITRFEPGSNGLFGATSSKSIVL